LGEDLHPAGYALGNLVHFLPFVKF